jgi:acyl carrier protein
MATLSGSARQTALPLHHTGHDGKGEDMPDGMASALSENFIKSQIVEFLGTNFLYDGNMLDLGENDSLLENGVIDQTGILELVLFVEDTYGFEVPEADLTPENFDTVGNVAGYVRQRLAAR